MDQTNSRYHVAVIGAGPAGIFAARELANANVRVALFNRDIKPGGLAEYGIYPAKHKMKGMLRSQFRQVIDCDMIDYFGNVSISNDSPLHFEHLWEMGFQGIMVTAGAQGTKWLGLPGEQLHGVYHAKDLVYHYNKLPPFSCQNFQIGKHVAILGVGNVMTDIARYMIEEQQVEDVTVIARRGPGEIKFDRKELEYIAAHLDIHALDDEIDRGSPLMWSLSQNPDEPRTFIHNVYNKSVPSASKTHLQFRFLLSPTRIISDDTGRVRTMEVEENTLVVENGEIKARGTGRQRVIDVDTIVFAIGDSVDQNLGLPVGRNEFVKNPNPRFPVDTTSYELIDPGTHSPLDGVFVAGWSRQTSTGLVGIAKRDGSMGARGLIQYLQTLHPPAENRHPNVEQNLKRLGINFVSIKDIKKLDEVENARAQQLGLEEFKFSSNEDMLAAICQV